MRIVFLSSWFPYPPDNGSRIRVFNLIKQLSKRHTITLLAFTQSDSDPDNVSELLNYCEQVRSVPVLAYQPRRWRAIQGFLSPRPRSLVDTYSTQMAELVAETAQKGTFDLVLASQISTVPYVQGLGGIKKVLEEVELTVIRDQAASQTDLLRRLRFGLTWWKTARFVMRALAEFDACTVVSEKERSHVLERRPDYPVSVVPNGVDLEWYAGDFGSAERDTLIFPAALSYYANLDAMEFFLSQVSDLIRARRPGTTLRITGRTDGVPVHRLPLGDGTELTGYLDDIRPAVARSWVCVVPLRLGGGTRLKILEAMALGTPVVSTTKGAEGLDIIHGENILIADEPAEFAEAVLRLLGDPVLRHKLATGGQRLVAERYSWEMCAEELERLLQRVVGQEKAYANG